MEFGEVGRPWPFGKGEGDRVPWQEMAPGEAAWRWVRQPFEDLSLGGLLIFVRGSGPEQMIRAHGIDPRGARMMTLAAASRSFPPSGPPWVRAGRAGLWAFTIEVVTQRGVEENVARRLSAGTEAVEVCWTVKPTWSVRYFADGVLATAFEPGMEWGRSGREPDRFVPAMRELGLRVDRPPPPQGPRPRRNLREEHQLPRRHPVVATLAMLTLALGIELPEEVAHGSLLTARRDSR